MSLPNVAPSSRNPVVSKSPSANREPDSITRATCWSVTENFAGMPIDEAKLHAQQVLNTLMPPGWKIKGQFEQGAEGTYHLQAMLKTPQVRFSSVKQYFPRSHIEVARDRKALAKYVSKQETRIAELTENEGIPTLFEFHESIVEDWVEDDFQKLCDEWETTTPDEVAMMYLDILVSRRIAAGERGIEFIAINPMFRSAWKKFYRAIIIRHGNAQTRDAQAS